MGRMLCLMITLPTSTAVLSDPEQPDPALLEFLGQTLELEQLGIDVDKMIQERLKEAKPEEKESDS